MLNKEFIKSNMEQILKIEYGKTLTASENHEKYYALSKTIMAAILDKWNDTQNLYKDTKQTFYLSAEFLMGRALGNNLLNLGINQDIKKIMAEMDIDINELEEVEEDAGLGNGGLGRLAACFMESSATLNLPVRGYGIRYKYGMFKQSFEDGFQIEEIDHWTKYGDPWSIRRDEDTKTIHFNGESVKAVPYDVPIIGYGTNNINTLRLWQAEPIEEFNYPLFNEQKYDKALMEKNRAEDISRILYPNDSNREGKKLRLKQQYFFVSAAIQDIVKEYRKKFGDDFKNFSDCYAIQLNDTHPVVAIPELMRILLDEMGMPWKKAWKITIDTFAYTNHTTLTEALEKWEIDLFESILPRVYKIIEEIDRQLEAKLGKRGYCDERVHRMKILYNGLVHMAWLAVEGSHTINGVAQLHSNILKFEELKDWYELYPEKFQNKTNGVTPRRWLLLSNPELSSYITHLLGNNQWINHLDHLKKLEQYQDNEEVLKEFLRIKNIKKIQLAESIYKNQGISINPASIYDIQIKRLHEYKRQLLNAFHILDLYYNIKESPQSDFVPRTFIFGGKAAAGYYRAKAIIKYINEIANLINKDPDTQDKLKIVFIENYSVSWGEKIFAAADLSEQISTAGKEASGTGNMKFMLNGTPTMGTYDGANIEIVKEAGLENNYIFGANVQELDEIRDHYNPREYYENIPGLKRVVDTLIDGTFDDGNTGMFKDLYHGLLDGSHWQNPDEYFLLKDFEDYRRKQEKASRDYKDRLLWAKKCWLNMCRAGKFSSDRTIAQYANEIWHIHTKKL